MCLELLDWHLNRCQKCDDIFDPLNRCANLIKKKKKKDKSF